MAQIFHPVTNTLAQASLIGGALGVAAVLAIGYAYERSPYMTGVGVALEQPVPFSHEHHNRGLGLDCRYCHASVEKSAFAGMPPTETCMTCHSQIWNDSAMLEPVRQSFRDDTPLRWQRVHNVPRFAYFDHSIHVHKGVGCATCHGPIDRMPLTWKVNTLYMEWCLECHREPERFLRPREEVFNMQYEPPPDQLALGLKLKQEYDVRNKTDLTNCSTCHR
jgi:hypothetical protein